MASQCRRPQALEVDLLFHGQVRYPSADVPDRRDSPVSDLAQDAHAVSRSDEAEDGFTTPGVGVQSLGHGMSAARGLCGEASASLAQDEHPASASKRVVAQHDQNSV